MESAAYQIPDWKEEAEGKQEVERVEERGRKELREGEEDENE